MRPKNPKYLQACLRASLFLCGKRKQENDLSAEGKISKYVQKIDGAQKLALSGGNVRCCFGGRGVDKKKPLLYNSKLVK